LTSRSTWPVTQGRRAEPGILDHADKLQATLLAGQRVATKPFEEGIVRRIPAKLAWRQAKRHPRTALKLTASGVSHPRRTAKLIRLARRASTVAQDTTTRNKARAATASAPRAAARARQIGPRAAAGDERFLAELRRAAQATVATYHALTGRAS
jgi:hypothetical protein